MRPAGPAAPPPGAAAAAGSRLDPVFVWGAVLVALALRLGPWRTMFADGSFVFHQPDAYYHLRRVGLILRAFPGFPGIDMYMAYPFGAECPWPPLYDLGVALLSYVAGLGRPSPRVVCSVATLLPPVLGALTILPVHALARLLAGPWAARVAAALAVAVPHHVLLSTVGSGDHHAAVTLLFASSMYFFVRSLASGDPRPRRGSATASGAFLGASVLVWQGAVTFAAVLAAGAVLCWLAARPAAAPGGAPERDGRALRSGIRVLGVAAAIASLGRLAYPSATEQTTFGFGFFSWFQPAFLVLLFSGLCLLLLAGGAAERRARLSPLRAAGVAVACLAVPAAALAAVPRFRENLFEAGRFVLTRDPWLRTISEFQPAIVPEMFSDRFLAVFYGLFAASLLVPAVVAVFAWARSRRAGALPEAVVFAVWTFVIGALALLQRRWLSDYALNVAIGAGWAVSLIGAAARRSTADGGRRPRAVSRFVLAPLVFLVVAVPQGQFVYDLLADPRTMLDPLYHRSLIWLRDNTPKPGDPWRADRTPDYAVLADWGYGHAIQYFAERPTVVNNFGDQLRGKGLEDMLRFLAAPDEAAVAGLCARRGVRYVFITNIYPPPGFFTMLAGPESRSEGARNPRGSFAYASLFFDDGQATPGRPAMTRFRLVFESRSDEDNPWFDPFRTVKIYEFVRGADIRGRAAPNEEVTVACRLTTGAGRVVDYRNSVRADGNGTFSVRFPYATTGGRSGVRASGPAVLTVGRRSVRVDVTEEDVTGGRAVVVGSARGRQPLAPPASSLTMPPTTALASPKTMSVLSMK